MTLGCVFPNGYASLLQNSFGRMVQVYDGKVRIKTASKQNADLGALIAALVTEAAKTATHADARRRGTACSRPAQGPLTYRQAFERIAVALDESWIVIPDTFLGIYSASNLPVKGRDALPVQRRLGLDRPFGCGRRRRFVWLGPPSARHLRRRRLPHDRADVVDDGAAMGCNPVIVMLANGIYGYEQFLVDAILFSERS